MENQENEQVVEQTPVEETAAPAAPASESASAPAAEAREARDYKDIPRLRKNLSERAKILPRRVTGTCAMHQRQLTLAIKNARIVALLPYITD